jgi:electron transfer flavoprotein beta subunit
VTIWKAADLDVDASQIGLEGSPTAVTGLAEAPSRERRREFMEGDPQQAAQRLADLLRELL